MKKSCLLLSFFCACGLLLGEKAQDVSQKNQGEEVSVTQELGNIQALTTLMGSEKVTPELEDKTTSPEKPVEKKIVKKGKKKGNLRYSTIVEISSSNPFIKGARVYVFPSNWMSPKEAPKSMAEANYELRVGENPFNDTQCSKIGFQFFSIESAAGKSAVVSYGDPVQIYAYSTSIIGGNNVGWGRVHNRVFSEPYKWYVSDKICPNKGGYSVFVAPSSRPEVQRGKQIFKFVNPENPADTGPVEQGSDVWIVSAAPGATEEDRVWTHEYDEQSLFYTLDVKDISKEGVGGIDRTAVLGLFTVLEVNQKRLAKKAKSVFDALIRRRVVKIPANQPLHYGKLEGFYLEGFMGTLGTKSTPYIIDGDGSLFSITIDKKKQPVPVFVSVRDSNATNFPIMSGAQHEGCFLVVHKDTKQVYQQNSSLGTFELVPPGQGKETIEIERVSCARNLASTWAVGYTKPGETKKPIYHYGDTTGWELVGNGLDVSVATDGTVVMLDPTGKALLRKAGKETEWVALGKGGTAFTRIFAGSRTIIFGVAKDLSFWQLKKDTWARVPGLGGKPTYGIVAGGASPYAKLVLVSFLGDAFYPQAVKKVATEVKKAAAPAVSVKTKKVVKKAKSVKGTTQKTAGEVKRQRAKSR